MQPSVNQLIFAAIYYRVFVSLDILAAIYFREYLFLEKIVTINRLQID